MTFKYEQESLTFEVIRYATEEVKKMWNLWDANTHYITCNEKNKKWSNASIIRNLYKGLFFPDEGLYLNSIHAQSRL